MARIDTEEERQRLVAFYAGQFDGELEKVALQAYDLTDLAQETLRAEIAKRGLTLKVIERPPEIIKPEIMKVKAKPEVGDPPPPEPPADEDAGDDGEPEQRNLVTLRQFRDLPEALLAQGLLASADIDAVLADDNVVRTDWFWSNAVGGVKLRVDAGDAKSANEILNQPIPENFDVAGVGEFEQPCCPKCQSLDVNFQELDPAAYMSLAISLPIPFHRKAWRCHSCKAEWEEDAEGGDQVVPRG